MVAMAQAPLKPEQGALPSSSSAGSSAKSPWVTVSGSGIGDCIARSTAASISARTSSRSASAPPPPPPPRPLPTPPEPLDAPDLGVDRFLAPPLLDLVGRHVLHVVV